MKYGTLIFTKVLSGLYQQKLISAEKRKRLLTEWNKGTNGQDYNMLMNLVKELDAINRNELWHSELNQVMESFTKEGGTRHE